MNSFWTSLHLAKALVRGTPDVSAKKANSVRCWMYCMALSGTERAWKKLVFAGPVLRAFEDGKVSDDSRPVVGSYRELENLCLLIWGTLWTDSLLLTRVDAR